MAHAKLRFLRPTLPSPEEWTPHLRETYRLRYFSNSGPAVQLLEQRLADRFGGQSTKVSCVSSCTSGLTATLMALGVSGPVIVPSFTFPATADAVLQAGCVPVLADVSPESWELSPQTVAPLIDKHKASAIVHVRTFGFCRNLSAMDKLAQAAGIPLIVDGAAALGGRIDDHEYAGSSGVAEVFSLHCTKVFGVGEGGAVFAAPEIIERVKSIVNFGYNERKEIVRPGFNGKMSEFHAAVGLAMLNLIDAHIRVRSHMASRYSQSLAGLELEFPKNAGSPPWQCFPLHLPGDVDAERFVGAMLDEGVETRRYYFPALRQIGPFKSYAGPPTPVASSLASGMVCLPLYSDMTDAECDQVAAAVRSVSAATVARTHSVGAKALA